MIIQIIAFILAVIAYSIKELCAHGKIKWSGEPDSFFGSESWGRKYRGYYSVPTWYLDMAPNTWYYQWFKIQYKERFLLSATALSFLTDGMHLFQMLFKIAFSIAIAGLSWWAVAWFLAWSVVFTVSYRLLSKG